MLPESYVTLAELVFVSLMTTCSPTIAFMIPLKHISQHKANLPWNGKKVTPK